MSSQFNGLLLINKEPGGTSHDVVARVRKILNTRDVGHAGTLDPIAGGLMVLLIGQGTKLSNYILERDKAYRAVAKLGVTTTTLDTTGEVLSEKPVNCSSEQIMKAVNELVGEFQWEVPIFSAVKVDGKALHKYARQGEEVVRPVKTMKFWDVKARILESNSLEIDMTCSKGSYVRSWIQHLGEKLGCGAAMSALTRTQSMPYKLENAITLEELGKAWNASGSESPAFISMIQALPNVRIIRVKGPDQTMLLNGQISHDLRSMLITQVRPETDHLIQIHSVSGHLIALIGLEEGKGFVIRRVFKND